MPRPRSTPCRLRRDASRRRRQPRPRQSAAVPRSIDTSHSSFYDVSNQFGQSRRAPPASVHTSGSRSSICSNSARVAPASATRGEDLDVNARDARLSLLADRLRGRSARSRSSPLTTASTASIDSRRRSRERAQAVDDLTPDRAERVLDRRDMRRRVVEFQRPADRELAAADRDPRDVRGRRGHAQREGDGVHSRADPRRRAPGRTRSS